MTKMTKAERAEAERKIEEYAAEIVWLVSNESGEYLTEGVRACEAEILWLRRALARDARSEEAR